MITLRDFQGELDRPHVRRQKAGSSQIKQLAPDPFVSEADIVLTLPAVREGCISLVSASTNMACNAPGIQPEQGVRQRTVAPEEAGQVQAHQHILLINKKNIFIGAGSIVKPGVVIDAEAGSVYIGKNVTILPQSTIIGPASIGDGSMIKAGRRSTRTPPSARCVKSGEKSKRRSFMDFPISSMTVFWATRILVNG